MKIRLVLCNELKRIALYVFFLLFTFNVIQAQVSTGLLCSSYTGQPPQGYGSGDCAGNNLRSYDLSSVYPDLTLYYNSLGDEHDVLDLGKRMTLGDVSFVDINPNKPFFWVGDGTIINLLETMVGASQRRYVAKDRSVLSTYFDISPNSNKIVGYAMDGTQYEYSLLSGSRFKLSSILSRTGIKSEISVGAGASQYLKFGADQINIVKEGSDTFFRNSSDTTKWVKLVKDNAHRLVSIVYYDGTRYDLVYDANTSLLLAETLFSPKSGVTETTKFLYDNFSRLVNIMYPNNTSVRYVRNYAGKFSKAIYPNGQVQQIDYDNNGYVKKIKTYALRKPEAPLQEATYSYDANGKFLSMTYPEGSDTIKIENQYSSAQPTLPLGYKKFKNGQLINQFDQARNLSSWLSEMDTLKDGSGKILSQVQYSYPSAYPFLLSSMLIKEGPGKGSKEEFRYQGATTTIISYNQNGTKTSTRVLNGDLPSQVINHLAPPSMQSQEFSFDANKRLSSKKLNGKEIAKYGYDSKGRQNYYKDENGDEHFTYFNSADYVEKEEHKLPSGLTTLNYRREFYPNSTSGEQKVKSMEITTIYPKQTVVEKIEYDLDGKVTGRWLNGVLVN